jgi:lipopolysaccharide biosynthesis regulator YciM
MKVSKEEWEQFQKWKKEKEKPKETEEPENLKIEPEEESFDLSDLVTVEETKEEETYVCGNCGYKDTKPFDVCPSCKKKLSW